jgi:hypothetical protein
MNMKTKIQITRSDLFVYAISGAFLFNLLQLILSGIFWLSRLLGSESILQGITYTTTLVLSVPGNYICLGLGLEHSRIPGISFLINGLVGAFLFTAVMFPLRFIQNGNREVKP